jgi:hypothetical protein
MPSRCQFNQVNVAKVICLFSFKTLYYPHYVGQVLTILQFSLPSYQPYGTFVYFLDFNLRGEYVSINYHIFYHYIDYQTYGTSTSFLDFNLVT